MITDAHRHSHAQRKTKCFRQLTAGEGIKLKSCTGGVLQFSPHDRPIHATLPSGPDPPDYQNSTAALP